MCSALTEPTPQRQTCLAPIQQGPCKGQLCHRPIAFAGISQYCPKHIRQAIHDKAAAENIRYCDIARGCFTPLEDHQSKCTHCLHKARIAERKRNDKKRQDPNLCLDCGRTLTAENRAIGKHDKLLRRCTPCYEILLKTEAKRPERHRNYAAEQFQNKHVAWNYYVKSAKTRNLDFTLPKAEFNVLLIQPCFYCNHLKPQEINGIDRVDNSKGYTSDNCVSCCGLCNMAKGFNHPQEFIDKLAAIHSYSVKTPPQPISPEIVAKWSATFLPRNPTKFQAYAKSANSRNLEFRLTEEEFNGLLAQPCYLCGLPPESGVGVDRVNNSKGYVLDNCMPSCGHCNLMKRDMTHEQLLKIATAVKGNFDKLTEHFAGIQISLRSSKTTTTRQPTENPSIQDREVRIYKPVNEVIVPSKTQILPPDIQELLEGSQSQPDPQSDPKPQLPKQWKTKQIWEYHQANNLTPYKVHCEASNSLSDTLAWEQRWLDFTLELSATKTQEEAHPIIKDFIEGLREERHAVLIKRTNLAKFPIEREGRQQWPSQSVLRAYKEGKIHLFKAFQEKYQGLTADDPVWLKRWGGFVGELETATAAITKKSDDDILKIIKKFMAAQRMQVYRTR